MIWVLNYAYTQADADQLSLLRQLGARCLPPVHCVEEVEKIMGWR